MGLLTAAHRQVYTRLPTGGHTRRCPQADVHSCPRADTQHIGYSAAAYVAARPMVSSTNHGGMGKHGSHSREVCHAALTAPRRGAVPLGVQSRGVAMRAAAVCCSAWSIAICHVLSPVEGVRGPRLLLPPPLEEIFRCLLTTSVQVRQGQPNCWGSLRLYCGRDAPWAITAGVPHVVLPRRRAARTTPAIGAKGGPGTHTSAAMQGLWVAETCPTQAVAGQLLEPVRPSTVFHSIEVSAHQGTRTVHQPHVGGGGYQHGESPQVNVLEHLLLVLSGR
jgi:hypothetical protein